MASISTVPPTPSFKYSKPMVSQTLQTLAGEMDNDERPRNCLIHPSGSHALEDCLVFKGMSLEDKKKGINCNFICYICLGEHKVPDCTVTSKKCRKCVSKCHHTLFHIFKKKSLKIKNTKISNFSTSDCSQETNSANSSDVTEEKIPTSLCTSVCGDIKYGRSCEKILLAKITDPKQPGKILDAYIILDASQTLLLLIQLALTSSMPNLISLGILSPPWAAKL